MKFVVAICLAAVVCLVSAEGNYDLKKGTLLKAEANTELWCKTCGVFVSIFDKIMSDQKVQAFLDDLLEDSICPRLPPVAEPECEKDIPKIVPAIISFLESLADARLCTSVGVCKESSLREMVMKNRESNALKVYNTQTCDMCHKFTYQLEQEVDDINPETVAQYKQTLLQACTKLGDLQEKCDAFVERNSYLLMYYIMKEKSEGNILKICEEINACQPSLNTMSVPPLPLSLVKEMGRTRLGANDADECERCQQIAAQGGQKISDPRFLQEVHDYIAHICSYAPPIKERCTESLTEMSTKVFDFLSKSFKPDGICEELRLCGDDDKSMKLQSTLKLGESKKVTYVS